MSAPSSGASAGSATPAHLGSIQNPIDLDNFVPFPSSSSTTNTPTIDISNNVNDLPHKPNYQQQQQQQQVGGVGIARLGSMQNPIDLDNFWAVQTMQQQRPQQQQQQSMCNN
jgi:hypothetical protein